MWSIGIHFMWFSHIKETLLLNLCFYGLVMAFCCLNSFYGNSFSGERPFKCKICKMSFTTNGNMHRHSRIHAKENDLSGSSGIKPIRPKPKTPTWKSRAVIPNASTPAPSLVIPPGTSLLSTELLTNMPKFSILEAKPVTQVLTPSEPVSSGQKRAYNFIEYSPTQFPSPPKKINIAPVSSSQVVAEKPPTLVAQTPVPTSITKKPKDSRTEIKTFTNSAHNDRKCPSEVEQTDSFCDIL
jgi:hypothetical protein